MPLKETMQKLFSLIDNIQTDLQKAAKGNKAASQRVRIKTILLEKEGKNFRKESMLSEKSKKKKKSSRKKSS